MLIKDPLKHKAFTYCHLEKAACSRAPSELSVQNCHHVYFLTWNHISMQPHMHEKCQNELYKQLSESFTLCNTSPFAFDTAHPILPFASLLRCWNHSNVFLMSGALNEQTGSALRHRFSRPERRFRVKKVKKETCMCSYCVIWNENKRSNVRLERSAVTASARWKNKEHFTKTWQ